MFQIVSRLVCTGAGSIVPLYQSYKAIKSGDATRMETWLMFWTVMGCIMAMESTVEWLFSWFPLYFEFKTVVILWLTLPQIQGSTYIYVAHVSPFLAAHEDEIDAAVSNAKSSAKAYGVGWLNAAVQRVRRAVFSILAAQPLEAPNEPPAHNARHPPTLTDPVSGATSQLYSMASGVLRQYGPAVVTAGSALLHPMNGRQPPPPPPPSRPRTASSSRTEAMRGLGVAGNERPRTRSIPISQAGNERQRVESFTSGRSVSSMTKAQARLRRAELEEQLREIESGDSSSPGYDSSYSNSSSPPTAGLHPRSVSSGPYPSFIPRDPVAARIDRSFVNSYGGFEEISPDELQDFPAIHAAAMHPGSVSPGGTKRASWWWWGQNGGQPGYDPIGSEDKME
ncbi:hypothetical protein RQP46_005404 [Phenoliferia psychrophenolica]